MEKKPSGLIHVLKVVISTLSISLIGISKLVQIKSHYLEEFYKTVKVAGNSLIGHTGHLMLLNTLPNLSILMQLIITEVKTTWMISKEKFLTGFIE